MSQPPHPDAATRCPLPGGGCHPAAEPAKAGRGSAWAGLVLGIAAGWAVLIGLYVGFVA